MTPISRIHQLPRDDLRQLEGGSEGCWVRVRLKVEVGLGPRNGRGKQMRHKFAVIWT
ncbi:hypothetical protein M378DRAFT_541466 [Amanita muscaria Koide BX008]|uniref:Uncharacterized protein n=1 Tax=Amanita muscaria (strain Koide BX008) TaxID=946122 RepID=A0A0C2TE30_AMAMK|nr:hypothetical protein M378DRAFT_541466 [Amanita muscaria Koide BX008]